MLDISIDFLEKPDLVIGRMAARIRTGIAAGIRRVTVAAEAVVVEEAPVREGNLRDAIMSFIRGAGRDTEGHVVPTAPYSKYVHEGTGIYGPHGTPIVPRVKKALAFTYGGRKVVVKSVKGQKKNPFVKRAKKRLTTEGIITREFWAGFNQGR